MLYVIAGHGGSDPGATGGGFEEHDLNVIIANAIVANAKPNTCILLNTDIDHYSNGTLSTMDISEDDAVIEIHMDAFSDTSAHGGHVIINSQFSPDEYDTGLEEMLIELLPGRSQTMVKRSDLYNCNVCANRNINYRLIEVGFITNDNDRNFVLYNSDLIGLRICQVFGIDKEIPEEVPEEEPEKEREINVDINVKLCDEAYMHIDKVILKN